ncbi:sodium-dependent bicarbonate transport family permease [Sphingomicrobium astaxanthinifaciens]|uniref:sodium-dependent bicarbonate transport family permease n=1 Tax=Sphingomicrobium astaxanthinifaciens TaxID=1227949 RepID=UPI001FCB3941|nr:sodium-dependent bicarbonate transport family permease [Sphingomicrobium astaxanthinifaciens]MCJ7422385.1 sodium-dependent bicarbonate transport family permease [Sphingomicrobium astaxanthinifaciens]
MILETLTSPIILFFVLGMFAGFTRSDLAIPEAMAKAMAIYLMVAIGLKGGVAIAEAGITRDLLLAGAAGVGLSFLVPYPAFFLLTRIGRLARVDAAATAAHYGSVSLVTYITAAEMFDAAGMPAAGFMVAVLALMEGPAIISGLSLARKDSDSSRAELLHEVLLNSSVVLLIGSMLIGYVAGPEGFAPIAPTFAVGYKGILALFLLDMGLLASRRLRETRTITWRLALLGILMPAANGIIGVVLGTLIGLEPGTAAILGVLGASASYIAVPAAMRLALPQADPGIYLSMSLGITFPFNVVVNIFFLSWLAGVLA